MSKYFILSGTENNGVFQFIESGKWDSVERRDGIHYNEPWLPLNIKISRNSPTDFISFGGFITCNEKYWTNVFLQLSDNGNYIEGLELNSDSGKYFIVNTIFRGNVLDYDKSVFFRDPFSGKILNVLKYVFIEEALINVDIFRVCEMPEYTFVSEKMKNLLKEASGISFLPIPELSIM